MLSLITSFSRLSLGLYYLFYSAISSVFVSCTAVLVYFSLICSKENVHRHCLRLLNHLHQKVLASYMETLMKTLEPPKQVF